MKRVQKRFWKTWRKLDPWTYKSGSDHEISLETRQKSFTRLIRISDRYQKLRQHFLVDILNALREETGVNFSIDDHEIDHIVGEFNKKGTLSKLVAQKFISSSRAAKYREVLNSDLFPDLLTKWEELQEKTKEVFNAPAEMKVFAYNDKMETDTTMTPYDSIKYHRMFLQTGIVAIDPLTGYVKAWIGGINHKYFQFDHNRTSRQVGSTFKPFVYATAIEQQRLSPCTPVYDLPVTISPGDGSFFLLEPWTPKNSHGEYTGKLFTLMDALKYSKNTVSAYLMKQLGDTEPVRNLLDLMGVSKEEKYPNGRYRVPKVPSICLGATDLTVLEMTGAYSTFANDGLFNKPIFITRIEDKNGIILYSDEPLERRAINPSPNYVMVEMLKYAGTGLWELKSEVGGKTGTTNDYVDGWFMGVTPSLVVGTWVGGEDRWIAFRSIDFGQGAYMAKPFFKNFIKRLEAEENVDYDVNAKFYKPPGDLGFELDCEEYNKDDGLDLDKDDKFEDEFDEDMFGDENIGTDDEGR